MDSRLRRVHTNGNCDGRNCVSVGLSLAGYFRLKTYIAMRKCLHETDMNREQVITALRGHEAELHRFGVSRLFLFGSVARNEAGPESDVDLFFDTDNPRFSLIELVDVQERVNAILGVASDVMTRASLHPMLRQRIEAEALRVF